MSVLNFHTKYIRSPLSQQTENLDPMYVHCMTLTQRQDNIGSMFSGCLMLTLVLLEPRVNPCGAETSH